MYSMTVLRTGPILVPCVPRRHGGLALLADQALKPEFPTVNSVMRLY